MFKNYIFDWSGTIVDDLGPVVDATNHVYREHGLLELDREGFRRDFRLPYDEFWAETLPDISLDEIERLFRIGFSASDATVPILPAARECLDAIRDAGGRLFVLSSMDATEFAVQASALGLSDHFEATYAGVIDKKSELAKMLRAHDMTPSETCFVGDMGHDIESALANDVVAIGVGTGYFDMDRLAAFSPDMLLRDLDPLRQIVQGMAGRRPIPTVGALIRNSQEQFLMIRTHKWSDHWGIPGGKIQRGETSEQALRREVREETGLEISNISLVTVLDSIDSPEFERAEHFLLQNYVAQTETCEVTLNDEAEEWKWVSYDEALRLDLNKPTRELLRIWKEGDRDRLGRSQQSIDIKGLELCTHIGVPVEERAEAQTLLADVEFDVGASFASMDDDIEQTVDYYRLSVDLEKIAASKERKLIETLASELCQRVMAEKLVTRATVSIRKAILPQTEHVGCRVEMSS